MKNQVTDAVHQEPLYMPARPEPTSPHIGAMTRHRDAAGSALPGQQRRSGQQVTVREDNAGRLGPRAKVLPRLREHLRMGGWPCPVQVDAPVLDSVLRERPLDRLHVPFYPAAEAPRWGEQERRAAHWRRAASTCWRLTSSSLRRVPMSASDRTAAPVNPLAETSASISPGVLPKQCRP